MRNIRNTALALALAAPLLASGCVDDEGLLVPETPAGNLFARYVAMGQSNTAGFMSAGINDSTQHLAYPALLAAMAGAAERFFVPELEMPGCPPPLVGPQPLTDVRVAGADDDFCALREEPVPPIVSNVAVPGSRIVDWVNNALPDSRSNPLTTLLLGGRTQLQAVRAANPTFVSVFPEGNEVLRAAAAGVPSLATPQAAFETALNEIVTAIRAEEARAMLIGVINVPLVSPALQPGAYYYALQAAGRSPKPVSANCAPGAPGASNLVSFGLLTDPDAPLVSCDAADPGVLGPSEIADLTARINAYNAALRQRAEANDWLYVDPMAFLGPVLADPDLIRKCQGLATATPATFAQAVETTCPGPDAPNFWGSYFSFDPIHFGPVGHQALAEFLAAEIAAHYEVTLPAT